jgi:hypothetical protein
MNGDIEAEGLPIGSQKQDVPNPPQARECSYEKRVNFIKPKVALDRDTARGCQQEN